MKFIALTKNTLDDLAVGFSDALNRGNVRGGELCLFFPRLSATDYLPYAEINHAFLRREEVKTRLCCGKARFDQIHLVTVDSTDVERQTNVESVAIGDEILALIAEKNPDTQIGYYKNKH